MSDHHREPQSTWEPTARCQRCSVRRSLHELVGQSNARSCRRRDHCDLLLTTTKPPTATEGKS